MLSTDTSTATGVLTSSTQTITLGFYFMANTDLVVTRTRSGVITTLTLDSDYSVLGAGNESGGSITVTGQASGDVITIERTVDYKQISDYIPLTKLSATTIERDFDRCAMRDQQIVRRVKSLEDTPSIGIEEAPLDGTPYARQDGDWTPLSGGGDMLKSTYDTANRGYVDRAVLADTATTAGTITGQGDAATKNVGTTTGTVAAGDDARIVAGGTAVQPSAIVDQTFAAVVSTNPYSATPALTPRRIGDRAYNTTSLEWWDGIATAGATTSWQLAASGGGGGSGDMTKAVYDTVNRGYVDRAVLADTATTAGTITGQGNAATKNVGTTAGTVAAGDDSRIVAGGTALQPTGDGSGLTGITASQVGAATAAQGATADSTASALTSHTGNTSNPHAVTKAQVGLPNVVNPTIYGGQFITDWNALTYTGPVTAYSTATGAPFASESAWGYHINSNTGNLYDWQFAVGYTTGLQVSRRKVNDTWEAWSSGVTATELAYVHGVTSAVQPQININAIRSKYSCGAITTSASGNMALADSRKGPIINVGRDGIELRLPVMTASSVAGTQYLISTLAGEAGTSGWAVKTVEGVLYFGRGIATGPEWCNTGVSLAVSSFYEICLKWTATSTDLTLVINGTSVTSGMTNNLTTAEWADCQNGLYFGSDASGANNVASGFVFFDCPELYNYAFTTDQWNTWIATGVAPTSEFGTMNEVENGDFLDGENDIYFNATHYPTHSVSGGILSFAVATTNPVSSAAYIAGSQAVNYFEPGRTYQLSMLARRAAGTTGAIGFGSNYSSIVSLTPASDDTTWHLIEANYTHSANTPVGMYGTGTGNTWEVDYVRFKLKGDLFHGLRFSAQPIQAHATNGSFWTLTSVVPFPYASSHTMKLKNPSVVTSDGSLGIAIPHGFSPVKGVVGNSGTVALTALTARFGSVSGSQFLTSVAAAVNSTIQISLLNACNLNNYNSHTIHLGGTTTGSRSRIEISAIR